MREAHGSVLETPSELSSGDIESLSSLGDFVDGLVLVGTGEVGHHLEGDHLDVQLISVLGNELLGIVGSYTSSSISRCTRLEHGRGLTVKVNSSRVLSGSGVVTSNDEVGRSKVLADDRVPDGLAGTSHPHREGKESEGGHTVRVGVDNRLVDTDLRAPSALKSRPGYDGTHSGEGVDISGLGESNDGVDKDVGEVLASSADGELPVSPVHGVSRLESDDTPPGELAKVRSELRRRVCESIRTFSFSSW